eukprot:1146849-Pelagomonas_calceolata.AAC.1
MRSICVTNDKAVAIVLAKTSIGVYCFKENIGASMDARPERNYRVSRIRHKGLHKCAENDQPAAGRGCRSPSCTTFIIIF